MPSGYTVNTAGLAIRVGELRAVGDSVEQVISAIDVAGCDLGPGGINAAVAEVVGEWRDGLGEMREKIDKIADNVRGAVDNYESIEEGGRRRMLALADQVVAEQVIGGLVAAAPVGEENKDVQVGQQRSRQGRGHR